MQDDSETYAELIRNNPFWNIFGSDFEVLAPPTYSELPELTPPDDVLSPEAFYSYGLVIILALICFFISKKNQQQRKANFPTLFFNEKHQWYYYQFSGEESSLMTGDEVWLPKNYYFNIDQEGFYYDDNHSDQRKVSAEDVRKAALTTSSILLFPLLIIVIGYLGTNYLYGFKYKNEYRNYLALIAEQEFQISLFNPYEGMCRLNSKASMTPQQMSVQVLYDLPEGSNPPITIESHFYLEGDVLTTAGGEIRLPTQNFLHYAPEQIIAGDAEYINFRDRASQSDNCSQGNTYFMEFEPSTDSSLAPSVTPSLAYLAPINDLKGLSLGTESGLYETKLFGTYQSVYLINASSYEIRTKQYKYSVDDIPGCDAITLGTSYPPNFMGVGNGFIGELVPWDTQPTETIDIPDFQMCSSVTHLEYQK
ncbi:MAG: hypothetical protein COA71_13165 [SAR86 cluster bacterium]|uniref:Uncharacterized protein n=1 Tax=SAR86 cluster bacterium TaxID=2030880 RepID=A0A2A5C7I5_9GAMM|nr:hypothetical protein [Gammaproteobacteria bacterium AH-315-E17]PCJ39829.1 MAG: hypothetical protein COA71_13165 [SAR86 cluster bacterium]